MNKGITVNELFAICKQVIANGNGNKHIQISVDDEGNGFHALFYGITENKEDIEAYVRMGMFHDAVNTDEIVLLG